MIRVQILTRNNEKTIERAIRSLSGIDAEIVVGDLGSSDSTLQICSRHGAKIIKIDWGMDYSAARNGLVSEDQMNLLLEPWEFIAKGHDEISACVDNANLTVIRGMSAAKELRLWKGLKFENPVYESVDGEAKLCLDAAIVSAGAPDRRHEAEEICSLWRSSKPTSMRPWYYSAFTSLSLGKKEEFIAHAERYIAMTSGFGDSETQIAYKMAQVLTGMGESKKAASYASRCLALNPTFAEFWCLFGDIFLHRRQYGKAKSMYLNAIHMGSKRANSDTFPIEIDKYKKYPEKMMEIIEEMDKTTKIILPLKQ